MLYCQVDSDGPPHSSVRVPPFVPKALAQMMQSCVSFSWAAIVRPRWSLLIALYPSLCGKTSIYQSWPLH